LCLKICESFSDEKRDNFSIDELFIPVKSSVNLAAVREGAKRFTFMLETCKPGTVPDAPLLAALLDLVLLFVSPLNILNGEKWLKKAPVIARAVIFVECAHFVHRCNKGQWPDWLKMSMLQTRTSCVAPLGRGTPSGLRRANLMLRAAGKMFYLWAEVCFVRP